MLTQPFILQEMESGLPALFLLMEHVPIYSRSTFLTSNVHSTPSKFTRGPSFIHQVCYMKGNIIFNSCILI